MRHATPLAQAFYPNVWMQRRKKDAKRETWKC